MDGAWGLTAAQWTAIYSIATSVYALLTGTLAFVTFYGLRKQANVQRESAIIQARAITVSNNRQQWINTLREEFTGFLTDIDTRVILRNDGQNWPDEYRRTLSESLRRRIYKIELLINPHEDDSVELVQITKTALEHGLSSDDEKIFIEKIQKLLKREWERVKSGE